MTVVPAADFATQARDQYRPGWSLPAFHFQSHECFDHELTGMREQMWWLAGHISQLRDPGDFRLFRFTRESIIIVRDKSGSVNAFYNVCRHRGLPVCREAQGSVQRFTCAYHGWTYKLDGSLLPPGRMPEEFNAKEYGMKRCHVEILDGLIFVSLATDAPPDFEAFAAPLRPYLKPYALERTKVVGEENFPTSSNWKVSIENIAECYHCGGVHKDMMRVALPLATYTPPSDMAGESWDERMQRLGRPAVGFMDDASRPHLQRAAPLAFAPGNVSLTPDGQPCSKLLGDMKEFSGGWTIVNFNPFVHAFISDDYVNFVCYTPLDAENTEGKLYWMVAEGAVEGVDYQLQDVLQSCRQVMMEDVAITDGVQGGIASTAYSQTPLGLDEHRLTIFHDWYFRNFIPNNDVKRPMP